MILQLQVLYLIDLKEKNIYNISDTWWLYVSTKDK